MTQRVSSANTSVNSKKVPRLFKAVTWQPGTTNLDYGGGKWDTATEYLKKKGVENHIYDPFNRGVVENNRTMSRWKYDTVTLSNVLCVIEDAGTRRGLVDLAMAHLKVGGTLYITIYEGDRSRCGKQTKKDCWQNNQPLKFYAEELTDLKPEIKKQVIRIVKREEAY